MLPFRKTYPKCTSCQSDHSTGIVNLEHVCNKLENSMIKTSKITQELYIYSTQTLLEKVLKAYLYIQVTFLYMLLFR